MIRNPTKVLPYVVETIDAKGNTNELLAETINATFAMAVFEEAVISRPNRVVIVRQGARLIRRSDRD